MAVGTKEITINFAEPRQTALRDWLLRCPRMFGRSYRPSRSKSP